MQRILIVEDNKTLAKLIAKKIKETLNFEVDVAYKLSEAKLFLRQYQYFITLLDINLPDAPNGEVVDYVLSHDNQVIVLSGNVDKEFRNITLKKNIVDYVNKGGIDDINYIIQTIQRLQKNKKHTVLVVDDSLVFRNQMKTMLNNLFYKVITVAHGEEALSILQTQSDISLVITDYNMPVMDGFELTQNIRKKYHKNELAIIALSSNNEEDINAKFLKHGANDYIKKPFSKAEFSCRVNNTIEALENLNIVLSQVNRDLLTGLYNRNYFLKNMHDYINEATGVEGYSIGMIDIDNLKDLSATYGQEITNKVVVYVSEILTSTTSYKDLIARFSGQEFCIALKNINQSSAEEIYEKIRYEVESAALYTSENEEIPFSVSIGMIATHDEDLEESISQADMMLYKAKQEGYNKILSV